MFGFLSEKKIKRELDENKAKLTSKKNLNQLQEKLYQTNNKINLLQNNIEAQQEEIKRLVSINKEDKSKKNQAKLSNEEKVLEKMAEKLVDLTHKASHEEKKLSYRQEIIEQRIAEIQKGLLDKKLAQDNRIKLQKEQAKLQDELNKWREAVDKFNVEESAKQDKIIEKQKKKQEELEKKQYKQELKEKQQYAKQEKLKEVQKEDYFKERIAKQQRLFKDDFKLFKVILNKINKNLEFNSLSTKETAPSLFNIGRKLIDKELIFSVFNNLEIGDLKITPKLQKDAQILADFFADPERKYDPETPPFFLWLLEEQSIAYLTAREDSPLIRFLVEESSSITRALEKVLTNIIIPKILENGSEKNLNLLAKKMQKHEESIRHLGAMEENLENLKKDINQTPAKVSSINKLEKRIGKLKSLQNNYQFALILNEFGKQGISGEFSRDSLVPIITELFHNILLQPDKIAKITIEVIAFLKTNDKEQQQKHISAILDVVTPKDLFTENVSTKINDLFVKHGEDLAKAFGSLVSNPEANLNRVLVKELNIKPESIEEVGAVLVKALANLPLNGTQLQNIYSYAKDVMTFNYDLRLQNATSLEEISVIDKAYIGKFLSLTGAILNEFANTPSNGINLENVSEKDFFNPKFQQAVANLLENLLPVLLNSSATNALKVAEDLANKLPTQERTSTEQLKDQIYQVIASAPSKLLKGVDPAFYPIALTPILKILGAVLQETDFPSRVNLYNGVSKNLNKLGLLAGLEQIKFIVSKEGTESKSLNAFKGLLDQLNEVFRENLKELALEKENLLHHITQLQPEDSVAKKTSETKAELIDQEIKKISKSIELMTSENLSAEKLQEIIEVLNGSISLDMERIVNNNLIPMLKNPEILSAITDNLIPIIMDPSNEPVVAKIVENFIVYMPGVREQLTERKIPVEAVLSLFSNDKSAQSISNGVLQTAGQILQHNLPEILKIYQINATNQALKFKTASSGATKDKSEDKALAKITQAGQALIFDKILDILGDKNNGLFSNINLVASLIETQKDTLVQLTSNILENNENFAPALKEYGISSKSIDQLLQVVTNFISKVTLKPENAYNLISQLQNTRKTALSLAHTEQFINDLSKCGIIIDLSGSPEISDKIKNEISLEISKLSPTATYQDFIESINDMKTTLPKAWQSNFVIKANVVDEVKFYELFVKAKCVEGTELIDSLGKLCNASQFIVDELSDSLTSEFYEFLNNQLKVIQNEALEVTLAGIDNPGEIIKDTMALITKIYGNISKDLDLNEQSKLKPMLSNIYQYMVISEKIAVIEKDSNFLTNPKGKKFLENLRQDRDKCMIKALKQVVELNHNPDFKDFFAHEVTEFFAKHHASLDLMVRNVIANSGMFSRYVDIKSEKLLQITKDNSKTLTNIGTAYLEKNYFKVLYNGVKLLFDHNVRSIIWGAVREVFNFKRVKFNQEVQASLENIFSEKLPLSKQDNLSKPMESVKEKAEELVPDPQKASADSVVKENLSSVFIKQAVALEKNKSISKNDKMLAKAMRERDLSGLPLNGYQFSNYNIESFNFSKAKFGNVNFAGSILSNTSFKDTEFLEKISFKGATIDADTLKTLIPSIRKFNKNRPVSDQIILDDIKIVGDISKLSFRNLSLQRADFSEIQIQDKDHKPDVKYADLRGAKFKDHTDLEKILKNTDKAEFDRGSFKIKGNLALELKLIKEILKPYLASLDKSKEKPKLEDKQKIVSDVLQIFEEHLKERQLEGPNELAPSTFALKLLNENKKNIAKDLQQALKSDALTAENITTNLQKIIRSYSPRSR